MPESPLDALGRIAPDFVEQLRATDQLIYADGALPARFKVLVALAFDAERGMENGVRSLARLALAHGATPEEIVEVLRVAYHLTGVPTVFTAARGLQGVLGEEE